MFSLCGEEGPTSGIYASEGWLAGYLQETDRERERA